MATISVLRKASKEAVRDLNELMRQLREGQPRKTPGETLAGLKEMLKNRSTFIIVAKDKNRIVGSTLLCVVFKVGKRIGYIEDVIIHEKYRGRGLGAGLVRKAIAIAKAKKLRSLGLTSRAERIAGNKLYQKLGFSIKKTNVYRLKL